MDKAAISLRRTMRVPIASALAVCVLLALASAGTPGGHSRKKSAFTSAPNGAAPVLTFTPGTAGTVAGTGVSGYFGDGGPATVAQFNFPTGMARDAQGNLYVADSANSVVRKFTVGGNVSTVAGNGIQGFSGDGGLATQAELAFPTAVALDASGNLFIADFFNACVRKVDTTGKISTFATASGFLIRGVATDSSGNVFFSGWYEGVWKADSLGTVTKIAGNGTPGFGGDGGPATSAQTAGVAGLAVDSQGNVYIAEVQNSDIRKIATNGIITTVAGNQQFGDSGDGGPATSAKLNGPTDVRVDAGGNLYIADSSNNQIRKVDAAGIISSIAGDGNYGYAGDGGLAFSVQFAGLTATVLDGSGNLYVADTGNSVIRRVKVDATALDFGTVLVGQTGGPIRVTVSNAGAGNLNISSIIASSNFAVQSTCPTSAPLSPGADCPVNISFIPTTAGILTGTVTVSDDAPGTPHVVSLKGQGNIVSNPDFTVSMSTSSLHVGTQSTSNLTTTVTPTQGFSGTIALSCSTLPAHATCSFSPASLSANGSNTALTSVLTISTGVVNVGALRLGDNGSFLAGITGVFSTSLFGLVFAGRKRGPQSNRSRLVALLMVTMILCGGLIGCGTLGGKTGTPTPAGTYTVTVTGTATGLVHSTTFTLVVQ